MRTSWCWCTSRTMPGKQLVEARRAAAALYVRNEVCLGTAESGRAIAAARRQQAVDWRCRRRHGASPQCGTGRPGLRQRVCAIKAERAEHPRWHRFGAIRRRHSSHAPVVPGQAGTVKLVCNRGKRRSRVWTGACTHSEGITAQTRCLMPGGWMPSDGSKLRCATNRSFRLMPTADKGSRTMSVSVRSAVSFAVMTRL